jgi:hypothetical protein
MYEFIEIGKRSEIQVAIGAIAISALFTRGARAHTPRVFDHTATPTSVVRAPLPDDACHVRGREFCLSIS